MLPKPAASATWAKGSSVDSISVRAVWARCGARQRHRSRAHLRTEHAAELALAEAEPARQAGHALAVHDPVGDQPERAAGHVGAPVPGR